MSARSYVIGAVSAALVVPGFAVPVEPGSG
jgi:hypothetical protein